MPYNTRSIKRDVSQIPIPQYFNEETDDFQVSRGRKGAFFVHIQGYAAKEPFTGSANTTHVFSEPMYGFVIKNDGSTDLTFTINNSTFTLKEGEGFDEMMDPFLQVSIVTTTPFRAYGRG